MELRTAARTFLTASMRPEPHYVRQPIAVLPLAHIKVFSEVLVEDAVGDARPADIQEEPIEFGERQGVAHPQHRRSEHRLLYVHRSN